MDFHTDVIARSEELPVVVDFWAPWCGPCRVLGPAIEQIAEEQAGRWQLVKVNTEEMQDVAARYGIRSIPNVKMFHRGEIIAEFTGALPPHAIREWLDKHLPDARKDDLQSLIEAVERGDENAVASLEAFVTDNPDMTEAKLALARHYVFIQPQKALELTSDIKLGHPLADEAEDIRSLGALMAHEPEKNAAGQAIARAKSALQEGELEGAAQALIEATVVDKAYADDLPRRSAIALFRMLGPGHPVTKGYRWKFDMALY